MKLSTDNNSTSVQAMPLIKGRIDLIAGVFTNTQLIHCNTDGDIIITWEDDTTTTKSMTAGSDRTLAGAKSVTVSTGSFDLA